MELFEISPVVSKEDTTLASTEGQLILVTSSQHLCVLCRKRVDAASSKHPGENHRNIFVEIEARQAFYSRVEGWTS